MAANDLSFINRFPASHIPVADVADAPRQSADGLFGEAFVEDFEMNENVNNRDAVLCYVSDNWAYFTTQELSKQYGDDWNDAPYEHNAGTPYEFSEYDLKNGKKPHP